MTSKRRMDDDGAFGITAKARLEAEDEEEAARLSALGPPSDAMAR